MHIAFLHVLVYTTNKKNNTKRNITIYCYTVYYFFVWFYLYTCLSRVPRKGTSKKVNAFSPGRNLLSAWYTSLVIFMFVFSVWYKHICTQYTQERYSINCLCFYILQGNVPVSKYTQVPYTTLCVIHFLKRST